MNQSKRFCISSIAIAFAAIVFVSSSALATPISGINIIIKKNPGGTIYRASLDANGNFTFKDLPPGKYEVSIVGSAEYFAAKKVDRNDNKYKHKGDDIDIVVGTNLILRSRTANGGTGNADSLAAINSSRSNIKRGSIKKSDIQNNLKPLTQDGKNVFSKVIIDEIIVDNGNTTLSGVIENFGIAQPGVK